MKCCLALVPLALAVSCATPSAQDEAARAEVLDRQAALDDELQAQLMQAYQEAMLAQKQAILQEAQARAQAADQPMLPTMIEVTATPRATLELKGVDQGKIRLDVKIPNPIGGPTVHHYVLEQLGSRWSLQHTGSTEYLSGRDARIWVFPDQENPWKRTS